MPFPDDLIKLNHVVKDNIVIKRVYDKLVEKVNNIDTSGFVLKTKYETGKLELKLKSHDTTDLVKNTGYNAKISELAN